MQMLALYLIMLAAAAHPFQFCKLIPSQLLDATLPPSYVPLRRIASSGLDEPRCKLLSDQRSRFRLYLSPAALRYIRFLGILTVPLCLNAILGIMGSREDPTFFLYSRGLPVDRMKLGTLVCGNFANPEDRCAIYQGPNDESFIFKQRISGTWASLRASRNRIHVGLQQIAELASVSLEIAEARRTIVSAEEGWRVTLRDPHRFFEEKVLSSEELRSRLALWLTVTKSSYLLKKVTFQRPKVYCLTGFYQLARARARSEIGAASTNVGIAAEGVPGGLTIGPLNNGRYIECDTYMKDSNVWAAQFHQLDVKYFLRKIEGNPVKLPATIALLSDISGDMTMSAGDVPDDGATVLDGTGTKQANIADVGLVSEAVKEVEDESDESTRYWQVFDKAKGKLEY